MLCLVLNICASLSVDITDRFLSQIAVAPTVFSHSLFLPTLINSVLHLINIFFFIHLKLHFYHCFLSNVKIKIKLQRRDASWSADWQFLSTFHIESFTHVQHFGVRLLTVRRTDSKSFKETALRITPANFHPWTKLY